MSRHLLLLTAAVLYLAPPVRPADADDAYQVVVKQSEHADIVRPDGDPVLRYMFRRDTSTPEQTFDTAKVFAHVLAPDGETTLTKGPGGKFPHHRGIFIGWNKIQHDGQRHDLWHVRNTRQEHREFLQTKGDKESGTITSKIAWIGVGDQQLIEEQRTYRITPSLDAYTLVDFTSELTATAGDLKLDGDPEHAGVQFRPSQLVAENQSAKYTFHEEGVDPKKQRDLPWVACTFEINNQTWTVQNMSHPSNPPGAIWSAYRDYGRFGEFAVIELDQGQTVKLQYRFRVTEGRAPSREQMDQHFQAYANQ